MWGAHVGTQRERDSGGASSGRACFTAHQGQGRGSCVRGISSIKTCSTPSRTIMIDDHRRPGTLPDHEALVARRIA
eukprot:5451344-Alexandrium_andersonii.AAC.1